MNLIFDLNYVMHKNVQTLHKMNRLYGDFHLMMNNNIEKYVNQNNWDKVIIVSDSRKKSWRQKDLDNQYKENRVKSQDIDWKWVYQEYNFFKETISEKYTVIERDHIEGDDWITAIILKANKLGQSNVFISSDNDLNQLLTYKTGDKRFINIKIDDKSGRERIFVPQGWEIWLKDQDNRTDDVFNLDNQHSSVQWFEKYIKLYDIVEVNKYQSLFKKLVMGDKGDNVPCPYKTLTKTGKERGIGDAGAEKLWQWYSRYYGETIDTNDSNLSENIVSCIENVNTVKLDSRRDSIVNQLNENIKLMELHYRHYPDWVLESIIDGIKDIF